VQLHSFAPAKEEFSKVLVDVFSQRVPELTVMDAIEGIEGDGPTTRGEKRKFGLLMISSDALLVDAISTRLMGLEIEHILTNRDAREKGLGHTDSPHIYLDGFDRLPDCIIPDFKMPATFGYSNAKVIKKLFDIAKFIITIHSEKCTKCLRCLDNCPVEAICKTGIGLTIDKNKCIQCMCCLEICPVGAVEVSKSKFYQQLKELRKRKNKN
jgi:ferredoxin